MRHAERGLDELHRVVDTLITIPNQRLLALAGKNTPMLETFRLADDVLLQRGARHLGPDHGPRPHQPRLRRRPHDHERDGPGADGHRRRRAARTARVEAAAAAISSPLLEDVSIEGARGVLINITGGPDLTLHEVNEASTLIQEAAHEDANIIFGAVIDEKVAAGEIRVTVIATGLEDDRARVGDRDHDGARARARPRRPRQRGRAAPAPSSGRGSSARGARDRGRRRRRRRRRARRRAPTSSRPSRTSSTSRPSCAAAAKRRPRKTTARSPPSSAAPPTNRPSGDVRQLVNSFAQHRATVRSADELTS